MWSTRCFDDLFRAFVYACCFDLFVRPLWSTHCFDVCFHTLFRLFSTCWVDALFRRPGSMLFFFFRCVYSTCEVLSVDVLFDLCWSTCYLDGRACCGRRVVSTPYFDVLYRRAPPFARRMWFDKLCRRPLPMCCFHLLFRRVFFFFSTCVVNVFFNGLYGVVVSVGLLDLCGRRVLSTFCFDVFVRPVWSTVLFV